VRVDGDAHRVVVVHPADRRPARPGVGGTEDAGQIRILVGQGVQRGRLLRVGRERLNVAAVRADGNPLGRCCGYEGDENG